MEFDIKVSQHEFTLTESKKGILKGDSLLNYDIHPIKPNEWQVYYKHKSYHVIRMLREGKHHYLVNGKRVSVIIQTELDKVLERLGMDVDAVQAVSEIAAPMPGAILEVLVKAGDTVVPGDKLIILEAMKMENIIKSPIEGTITEVKISKGQNVEKGQTMITF